jgi:L-cysteine desulfidase
VDLRVDRNVFKNGLAVSIPGTGGLKGLDLAAALGTVLRDPHLGMEVLSQTDSASIQQAQELVRSGKVRLDIQTEAQGLFIEARLHTGGRSAAAVIRGAHDNIVTLKLDGQEVVDHPLLQHREAGRTNVVDLESQLNELGLKDLLALAATVDDQDEAFLLHGLEMNRALAASGLEIGVGLGVGRALTSLAEQGRLARDMLLGAKVLTSAAADARMAGVSLPAMSSAGSGNNGLTAVLPLQAVQEAVVCPQTRFAQALALSHLVTAYIKTHTGKLSAICSCSIAAGAGAAAGIVHMLEGDEAAIGRAVTNVISDLGGVICDGAKAGCALKLATASGSAVQSALLAMEGIGLPTFDGLVGRSPEETIQNLGVISREGMRTTDGNILSILMDRQAIADDEGA